VAAKVLGLLAVVAIVCLSYWAYIGFLKPIAPIPAIANELKAHFSENGLVVTARAIRHGFSEVEAAIEYELPDEPRGISVAVCGSVEAARAHYLSVKNSPNLNFATRNGRMVLFLTYWEESELTNKVLEAFSTFVPTT
jgi:hypothetical protein